MARKKLQILSSRLYDMKERFVKIVHKINADLNDYNGQISSEEGTSIKLFHLFRISFLDSSGVDQSGKTIICE